jgi:hypothetical protein
LQVGGGEIEGSRSVYSIGLTFLPVPLDSLLSSKREVEEGSFAFSSSGREGGLRGVRFSESSGGMSNMI